MPLIPPVARPQLSPLVCIDYVAKHYSNSAIFTGVNRHSSLAKLSHAAPFPMGTHLAMGYYRHGQGSSVHMMENMA